MVQPSKISKVTIDVNVITFSSKGVDCKGILLVPVGLCRSNILCAWLKKPAKGLFYLDGISKANCLIFVNVNRLFRSHEDKKVPVIEEGDSGAVDHLDK